MSPRDIPDALFDALMSEGAEELWASIGDEVAADLVACSVGEVASAPSARAALLAAAARPPIFDHLRQVAELMDVGLEVARSYLGSLGDSANWVELVAGARLRHVAGGPALAAADVGFVELDEGIEFPVHAHVGEESTLVLRGTLVDSLGNRVSAGELCTLPPGSRHSFRSVEGTLLFAVVVFGVAFDDLEDIPGHD